VILRRSRRSPAAWFASGTLCAVLGLGVTGFGVTRWVDRAAYLSAQPCANGRTRGCLRGIDAEVAAGGDRDTVLLVPDGGGDPDDPEVIGTPIGNGGLRAGDRVRALFWHGSIVRLEGAAGTAETDRSPVFLAAFSTAFGLYVLTLGVTCFAEGVAAERGVTMLRAFRDRSVPRWWVAIPAAQVTALATFAGTFFRVCDPLPMLAVAGVAAVVSGGVVALLAPLQS
jgi:hypothetical protein